MRRQLLAASKMIGPGVCPSCGVPWDRRHVMFDLEGALCGRCFSLACVKQDADFDGTQKERRGIEERAARFKEFCPLEYQQTDIERLPMNQYGRMLDWKMGGRGILCMGDSRTGKTRSCWKIVEQLYIQRGVGIMALSETEFSIESGAHHRARDIDAWLKRLCLCQLLFIDDIGHLAAGGTHLEEMLHVVESRTKWQRPIIATTQFSGDELKGKNFRNASKTIDAIVNRLREFCEVVNF